MIPGYNDNLVCLAITIAIVAGPNLIVIARFDCTSQFVMKLTTRDLGCFVPLHTEYTDRNQGEALAITDTRYESRASPILLGSPYVCCKNENTHC